MEVDLNKIRKENGWKVKRRVSNKTGDHVSNNKGKNNHQSSAMDLKVPNQNNLLSNLSNSSSSNEFSKSSRSNVMSEEQQLMQKLVVEAEMRKREQQAMLQKEALRVLREADRQEKLEQARKEREAKRFSKIIKKLVNHHTIGKCFTTQAHVWNSFKFWYFL